MPLTSLHQQLVQKKLKRRKKARQRPLKLSIKTQPMQHQTQEAPHLKPFLKPLLHPRRPKQARSLKRLLKPKKNRAPSLAQTPNLHLIKKRKPVQQQNLLKRLLLRPFPLQQLQPPSLQDQVTHLSRRQAVKVTLQHVMCCTHHSFLFVNTLWIKALWQG